MSAIATKEEVLQRVITVVAVEACVSAEDITGTTKLDDLGIDSLDFVSLMQALDIPQNTWEGINTVADLVRVLMPTEEAA
jgi:acyl carrier protein